MIVNCVNSAALSTLLTEVHHHIFSTTSFVLLSMYPIQSSKSSSCLAVLSSSSSNEILLSRSNSPCVRVRKWEPEREKKKREILGLHPSGSPTLRAPTLQASTLQAPPFGSPHTFSRFGAPTTLGPERRDARNVPYTGPSDVCCSSSRVSSLYFVVTSVFSPGSFLFLYFVWMMSRSILRCVVRSIFRVLLL